MVSVIIPVYNVEQYLRRCIDSVLAQTYTDLEIILVDDGSPDGSGAICDEYAAKDSRIKVIHQANAGVSAARNAGMDLASGEYLAFIDSDDFIEPEMYEQMLAAAEKTGADVVECNYQYGTWENTDSGEVYVDTGLQALKKAFFQERYGSGHSICPCTKLMARGLFEKVRFLEGCSIAEDVLFCAQLYALSETSAKLDKTFYTYYQSEGSAIRGGYRVKTADEVDADRRLIDVMEQTGDEELIRFAKGYYLAKTTHHWVMCHLRRVQPEFKEKAKQLRCQFRQDYPAMKADLSKGQRLKFTLFLTLPGVYCEIYARKQGCKE